MNISVTGLDNCVITSSIDRSIKVWDLDYIFEKEQHIDKHELTIDSLSISTKAQIAVVVTRSCIGTQQIIVVECPNKSVFIRYLGFHDWQVEVQACQLCSWRHNYSRNRERGGDPRRGRGVRRPPLLGPPVQEGRLPGQAGGHPANILL